MGHVFIALMIVFLPVGFWCIFSDYMARRNWLLERRAVALEKIAKSLEEDKPEDK